MPGSKCTRVQKRSTASIWGRLGEWWTWMEGGEGEGDNGSSMRSSRIGGARSRVGRPRKAPKLAAKPGGQPLAAKPLPAKQAAAQVDAWVAAPAGAMPEWQKPVVAADGEVFLLRGKLQEADSGRRRRSGGQRWRSGTGTSSGCRPANPSRRRARTGNSTKRRRKGGGQGRGGGGGGGGGTRYLMAGSQAWKAQAEKAKGELSTVAATARLLLSQIDGPTFESVVLGSQAAYDSHDDVEGRYPGDALVEAATNPGFQPPPPPPPPPPPAPRSPWV